MHSPGFPRIAGVSPARQRLHLDRRRLRASVSFLHSRSARGRGLGRGSARGLRPGRRYRPEPEPGAFPGRATAWSPHVFGPAGPSEQCGNGPPISGRHGRGGVARSGDRQLRVLTRGMDRGDGLAHLVLDLVREAEIASVASRESARGALSARRTPADRVASSAAFRASSVARLVTRWPQAARLFA